MTRRGFLQRKCACGGVPGMSGDCGECREKQLQRKAEDSAKPAEASSIVQQSFLSPGKRAFADGLGHDFSRIPIHSHMPATHGLSPQSTSIDAASALSSPGNLRQYSINGPGEGSAPAPSSPARGKKEQPPPAKASSNCPSDIQVATVLPANDVDFGKNGFLTGWGGISLMEVSDPSGKTWDGTAIHESLKSIKNTCGDRGKNACSNKSSDQARTTAGSTFAVGAESNFLGKAKLAAVKNKFYDLHVFATKDASLLHELKKDSCEAQCQQSFSCGGKRFGPDFIITYTMTRDVVKSGSKNINVTRVAVNKAAAAKRAVPGG
jgi:hypothetical protein